MRTIHRIGLWWVIGGLIMNYHTPESDLFGLILFTIGSLLFILINE